MRKRSSQLAAAAAVAAAVGVAIVRPTATLLAVLAIAVASLLVTSVLRTRRARHQSSTRPPAAPEPGNGEHGEGGGSTQTCGRKPRGDAPARSGTPSDATVSAPDSPGAVSAIERTLPRLRRPDHGLSRPEGGSVLAAAPTYLVLGLLLYWSHDGGGFDRLTWYRGTLFVLALAGAVRLAEGAAPRLNRSIEAALALLAAFAVWSYASIAWAGTRSDALDAANRTLLYLLVFWLFVRRPWSPRSVIAHVLAFAVGVTVVGFVTIHQTIHAVDPTAGLIGERMADPTGYPNGTAALYLLPLWPVIYLATRRESSLATRAVAGAIAPALLCLSLIPQSRGAVFTLPVVALLYLLLVPDRLRQLLAITALGLVAYILHGRLFDVYASARAGSGFVEALVAARNGILVAAAVTAAATAIWALLDRRVHVPISVIRRTSVAVTTLGLIGVVAAPVAFALTGHPVRWAEANWRDFKRGVPPSGSSHLSGLGSYRYDTWRVSLDTFVDHPFAGVGAGNFEAQYLVARRSPESPSNPHSLEMEILVGTGVVGALLIVGFLTSCGLALRRGHLREPAGWGLAAAAATSFGYFLLHGSVDWLWEFPALGGIAFALLAIGVRTVSTTQEHAPRRVARTARLALMGTAMIAATAAAAAIVLPLIGLTLTQQAVGSWWAHPDRALQQLNRARSFDLLDSEPDIAAGVIATKLDRRSAARAAFARATGLEPQNWYAWLRLAVASADLGRRQDALTEAARAAELNPRDPLVKSVRRAIEQGRHVSGTQVDTLMARRVDQVMR